MPAFGEREVSIFRNGRSRAVRIPADFDVNGESLLISQDHNGVIYLRPKIEKKSLAEVLDWLAEQEPLDFPDIEDYPPEPVDLEK
ncbi:antitoxin [Rhizobium sp. HT1-10]|uniref:antitoxin n=1 Tax=Rhizobium sp. HT1-10 TaxID=3111638 RepID=UPI003C1E18D2